VTPPLPTPTSPTIAPSRSTVPKVDVDRVRCPAGFTAGGATCGIKPSGNPDLAVIHCPAGASAAGVFTTNLVRAAPLDLSATNLKAAGGRVKGVVISSGCANAATGEEGRRRASRVVEETARLLGCAASEVLINSTGVIGVQLPDDKIAAKLPGLVAGLCPEGLPQAVRAIMTTDTRPKAAQATISWQGRTCTVAGIVKGSGMIHPNMATMIGVILTDAAVAPLALDGMLRQACERSFHRISVDGDTSTNDSVFLLASGKAGEFPQQMVADAVTGVARSLALQVVMDGEGAKRLLHVRVTEARTTAEALQVARTVAGSLLVRTAIAGGDPNWGRILAAIGRSGVAVDIPKLRVSAGGLPLFVSGAPAPTPRESLRAVFTADVVPIDIALAQGQASDEFFTCDLTEGYVQINAHYTT
jgi:glutamate N-acetyltransferase / amino-acid N-acetyltransferase